MVFKNIIKKAEFTVLFLILTSVIFTYRASALSIGIDKPHIDVISEPGTSESGVIQVRNKGEISIAVEVSIEDWIYDKEGKRVFCLPNSTPLSCADWIDLSPRRMVIAPNEAMDFNYTVSVPQDAIGGHYAVIFFSAQSAEEETLEGSGVRFIGRIGSIVYQETEGRVNKIGSVRNFEVSKPEKNKPFLAKYQFKNEGNTYIKFIGTVNIMDKKGNLYGNAESEKGIGTLPKDEREDTIKWFGSLPEGDYDLILTVDMGEGTIPIVKQASISIEEAI